MDLSILPGYNTTGLECDRVATTTTTATTTSMSRPGWIDWRKSAAKEILLQDLETGGWLDAIDNVLDKAPVIFQVYKHTYEEYEKVVYDQFEARLKDYVRDKSKIKERSNEEEKWMREDRKLRPRQTHNQRGEPVFDMDYAKHVLREDVKNNVHLKMKPKELWGSKTPYQKFKPDIFRQRIYQEVRRNKMINHMENKRTKRRQQFKTQKEQDKIKAQKALEEQLLKEEREREKQRLKEAKKLEREQKKKRRMEQQLKKSKSRRK